jgi:hypothetical protein
MAGIERESCRSGFVKCLRESRHLPVITFEAANLPEDVVALVDAHLVGLRSNAERKLHGKIALDSRNRPAVGAPHGV